MEEININETFKECLSQACYHIEVGEYEIAVNRLNEAEKRMSKITDNELFLQYYQIRIDLNKQTNKRKDNFRLWDLMEKYCIEPIHNCIRLSGMSLDYLMMDNNDEAIIYAEKALVELTNLPEENSVLALQVIGEVQRRKQNWQDAITKYSLIASIAEKNNNKAFISLYHAKIAVMLKNMGYYNIAIDRLFEAEEQAQLLGNIDIIQKISIWRADIYREIGEIDKAMSLLQIIAELNDKQI